MSDAAQIDLEYDPLVLAEVADTISVPTVTAVRCSVCRQLHDVAGQTFVTFAGNVNVGLNGGVVGNNFDNDGWKGGRLVRVTVVCRTQQCVEKLLQVGIWPKRP